jgi:hypothetical protein
MKQATAPEPLIIHKIKKIKQCVGAFSFESIYRYFSHVLIFKKLNIILLIIFPSYFRIRSKQFNSNVAIKKFKTQNP